MVRSVNAIQASDLIARGEVDVIDVREPNEWHTGHLEAARLVPLGAFRTNPKAALFARPVLFVCAAGVRSEAAARLADSHGATAYNLSGGTRAWVRAGLPLRADETVTAAE